MNLSRDIHVSCIGEIEQTYFTLDQIRGSHLSKRKSYRRLLHMRNRTDVLRNSTSHQIKELEPSYQKEVGIDASGIGEIGPMYFVFVLHIRSNNGNPLTKKK